MRNVYVTCLVGMDLAVVSALVCVLVSMGIVTHLRSYFANVAENSCYTAVEGRNV